MPETLTAAPRPQRAEARPHALQEPQSAPRPIELEPGIRLLTVRPPAATAAADTLVLSSADAALVAAVALRMAAADRPLRYHHIAIDGAPLGALADGRHGWPSFFWHQLGHALRRHRHRRLIVAERCAATVPAGVAVSTELGPVRLCRALAATYPALPVELLRLRADGRLAADDAVRCALRHEGRE